MRQNNKFKVIVFGAHAHPTVQSKSNEKGEPRGSPYVQDERYAALPLMA